MPKDTATHSDRADSKASLNTLWPVRSDPIEMWSRTCDLYARYFSALSKVNSPEGFLSANAELLAGGMETIGVHTNGHGRLETRP